MVIGLDPIISALACFTVKVGVMEVPVLLQTCASLSPSDLKAAQPPNPSMRCLTTTSETLAAPVAFRL